ncbi:RDD family protein [[Eubacterium] cellulosolvens]
MPYCPACGKEVPSDAKFCTSCGAALGVVTPAAPPPPSGYAPPSPLADLGSRIVAGLIDYIILGVIAAILFFLAFAPLMAAPAWMMGGWGATWGWGWFGGLFGTQFFLWLIYFTYFEGTSGQTIGKKFAHVRVVKEDGSSCDFGSALVRSILRIIDSLPAFYILGIILIAATDKKQRLGDMLAKTIVVKA